MPHSIYPVSHASPPLPSVTMYRRQSNSRAVLMHSARRTCAGVGDGSFYLNLTGISNIIVVEVGGWWLLFLIWWLWFLPNRAREASSIILVFNNIASEHRSIDEDEESIQPNRGVDFDFYFEFLPAKSRSQYFFPIYTQPATSNPQRAQCTGYDTYLMYVAKNILCGHY